MVLAVMDFEWSEDQREGHATYGKSCWVAVEEKANYIFTHSSEFESNLG